MDLYFMQALDNCFKLTKNEKEAAALVKQDLFQVLIQSSYSKVTAYQFINRLLVIFQQPTKLVIYEKVKSKFIYMFDTLSGDIVSGESFSEYLQGDLTQELIDEYAVCVFNTTFYILPIRTYRDETTVTLNDKLSYIPLTYEIYAKSNIGEINLGCIRIFNNILSFDEIQNDLMFDYLQAERNWQRTLGDAFRAKSKIHVPRRNENVISSDLEHIDNILEILPERLLEESYEDFNKSVLLFKGESLRPPNIAYFIRTFDHRDRDKEFRYNDDANRKGKYNYRLRMAIPPTQEKDFRRAFQTIKILIDKYQGNDFWIFNNRKLKFFYHAAFDTFFKQTLETENGIGNIIQALKTPYGQMSRSFVEPAFATSFTDIRRSPLDRFHGLDRLSLNLDLSNFNDLSQENKNEALRIVSLFYLFSTMAPEVIHSDEPIETKVSCLVKPLRVGQSPWVCAVSFAEFPNSHDEYYLSWQLYRHWYYDVSVVQGRRIRDRAKGLFLDSVNKIVLKGLCLATDNREEGLILKKEKAVYEINKGLLDLSRIYPFRTLSIDIIAEGDLHNSDRDTGERDFRVVGVISKKGPQYLRFSSEMNAFFPAFIEADFTLRSKAVERAIKGSIFSYVSRKHTVTLENRAKKLNLVPYENN
jgi:hypothetical protein